MNDFKAKRPATGLAVTTQADTTLQLLLLLRRKVEKSQGEEAGTVRQPDQQLPTPAEHDFGQLDFALHNGTISGAQRPDWHYARTIFVAQGKQKQQVLNGLDTELSQPLCQRIPDPLEGRDRTQLRLRRHVSAWLAREALHT
jgi:hypothetical protein